MRARIAGLSAALLLSACTEGTHPPKGSDDPGVVAPVDPTDVLGEGTEVARPPSSEDEVAVEVPTPMGQAEVVGLASRGLSDVSQVDVDLRVSGISGKRTVEVEFVSPEGHPYQRRSSVVVAKPDVTRTLRFSMPVAGTTVATSLMSGTWSVRFFLDGAPLTTASFTLEP